MFPDPDAKITFFLLIIFFYLSLIIYFCTMNVTKNSQNHLSNPAFTNVQALANNEGGGGDTCYKKMQGHQGYPMEGKICFDIS